MAAPAGLGPPRGSVASAVASSVLATGAVVALLVGLNVSFGESAERAAADAVQAADPGLVATVPDTGWPVAGPVRAGPPTPPVATAGDPAAPAGPRATKPEPPAVGVAVLNQTTRRGLAARFRELLAERGWTVGGVGDFRGNVPETTVYYPKGMKAEARALAAAFAEVDRVRPAFPGIPTDKLTVILCKDYPRT